MSSVYSEPKLLGIPSSLISTALHKRFFAIWLNTMREMSFLSRQIVHFTLWKSHWMCETGKSHQFNKFLCKCVFLEFQFCSCGMVWMFIHTKDKSAFWFLALKCVHDQCCMFSLCIFICIFQTVIGLVNLFHFDC